MEEHVGLVGPDVIQGIFTIVVGLHLWYFKFRGQWELHYSKGEIHPLE